MSTTGMTTIECPGCKRTLPPSSQRCQFCGSDLGNVVRPKAAPKKNIGPEPWVMKLYYAVAAYWILDGLLGVISNAMSLSNPKTFSSLAYLGIAIGLFAMSLGLGLLLLNLLLTVISVVMAGLQIWLISETDYMF